MPGASREVVLASRNRKKLAEMQALLAPLGMTLSLVSEFSAEAAEETAPTFVENALLKARHAATVSGLPAIADDSGIEVDALLGRPGVYSARYAGASAGDADNNARLLHDLAGVAVDRRSARFVCVMAFLRHAEDPVPVIAQGLWRGRILDAPRGANGFGYDPLFWVPDHGCSSAELDADVKNRISHRAQAAAALLAQLGGA
ncbi:MAG: RdgB/HAM1 family non-canonical purine NTP pyrophosphatase [Sinimarinibacterium sp.]|jgi:XTP/dITP diphosphohydrolase